MEAMKIAARTDALITDPVYEGKSMAGMIQLIKEGSIAAGSNVLYVHLGGQPALNAYSSYFED
jgi:1-aminocyclopropane-1-carboxylate deaminase